MKTHHEMTIILLTLPPGTDFRLRPHDTPSSKRNVFTATAATIFARLISVQMENTLAEDI